MSRVHSAGFTLIELLLSVVAMGIIVGISAPLYVSYQTNNELDIKTQEVASALRRAQLYSRSGHGDSQWGIEVAGGNVTLFRGTTYASRDSTYDEIIALPASISASGITTVVFTKLLGSPSQTGAITLTSTTGNARSITINSVGMVAH